MIVLFSVRFLDTVLVTLSRSLRENFENWLGSRLPSGIFIWNKWYAKTRGGGGDTDITEPAQRYVYPFQFSLFALYLAEWNYVSHSYLTRPVKYFMTLDKEKKEKEYLHQHCSPRRIKLCLGSFPFCRYVAHNLELFVHGLPTRI